MVASLVIGFTTENWMRDQQSDEAMEQNIALSQSIFQVILGAVRG